MTVMSLTMMTLTNKCNLCRKSQSNIGSSAISTDEHPGIRRLRKIEIAMDVDFIIVFTNYSFLAIIVCLETAIMKLTPWNAKEVEYVDQAHANGVQAGMNVFDTHCYNKTRLNKCTLGRWMPPGKEFEIRGIGCLTWKSHVEEDRSVDNLLSAKTYNRVLRGIRC